MTAAPPANAADKIADDEAALSVARVALAQKACFDYAVPEALRAACRPGVAVEVQFRTRPMIGYVVGRSGESPHRLKPIVRVVDDVAPVPEDLLKLARFIADYYMCSEAEALRLAVPQPLRRKVLRQYRLTDAAKKALKGDPAHPLAPLKRARTHAAIAKAWGVTLTAALAQLERWEREGLVEVRDKLSATSEVEASASTHRAGTLNPSAEQASALAAITAAIDAGRFAGFLLWGITGSGKTEVYLSAIAHALAQGKTALVLVPEIGLTPQTQARFAARFGRDVVTLHSGQTVALRRSAWRRVEEGYAKVVVGPRSALFAPLKNLGVIIVDEEHDDSYKQDEAPRYHARDVALVRAQYCQAVAILGSATPSLESINNARVGKLTRLAMLTRPTGGILPEVELVPLLIAGSDAARDAARKRSGREIRLLSPALVQAIRETVESRHQAILFLNRRGFAPFVLCQSCGQGFRCGECSVSLTHHLKRGILLCHYCGYAEPAPTACHACGSAHLRTAGSGTERLEIDLRAAFPHYRIARLDRDVAARREDMGRVLAAFREGAIDILVGTQMVTKGHDFPKVTLVGVVFADAGLNFPDFRAAERTAQLLVQVAGRAGRGARAGRVLVQTCYPSHPAIVAAKTHDYERFAEAELAEREALRYPPFARVLLLRVEGEALGAVQTTARDLAQALRAAAEAAESDAMIMGPTPCPIERIKGQHRMMILLKAAKGSTLRALVRAALAAAALGEGAKLVIDVDPVSML